MSDFSSTRRPSASPSQASPSAWGFSGGAGSRLFLGCGGCGRCVGEVESRDAVGLRGVVRSGWIGAHSQEDVGDGTGMVNEGALEMSINLSCVEQVKAM